MENEDVQAQDSNEQQEEVLETSNETQEEEQDTTDWKAKALKAEELANNQRIRAEKAEKLAKANKSSESSKHVTPELDNATIARIYNIHEDDIAEVLDMAKFKKLSLAETLKLGATKAILAENAEFRKTSEMANTGNARRGATKVSTDTLVKNLSEGKVPEDRESNEEIFWARRGGRR